MCNHPEVIENVTAVSPEEHNFPTDHHIIEFQVKLRFKRAKPITRTTYNYEHGNFNDLRSFLLRERLDIDLSDDIDVCWSKWKNLFSKAVAKFIPVKTIKDTNSRGSTQECVT